MTLLLQECLDGLALGCIYAIFSMGFSLVFGVSGVLNLAQGVYATWGAIGAWWVAAHAGAGFALALIAGAGCGAGVSLFVDQVGFERIRRRDDALVGTLVASIGLWIALEDLASIVTGASVLEIPTSSLTVHLYRFGGLRLTTIQVLAIGAAVVLAGAVIYLLRATRLGAAIRAVGWSRQAVEIVGVNPRATLCIAAIVAGALCGIAGVLLGELTAISYTLGDNLLLAGFAAVVIGGVGDIRGAVLGGLVIGVVETLSALYISETFQDAITFGMLLAFLLFRPRGLFGSREAMRA